MLELKERNAGTWKYWVVLKELQLGSAFWVGTNTYRDVGIHTPNPRINDYVGTKITEL